MFRGNGFQERSQVLHAGAPGPSTRPDNSGTSSNGPPPPSYFKRGWSRANPPTSFDSNFAVDVNASGFRFLHEFGERSTKRPKRGLTNAADEIEADASGVSMIDSVLATPMAAMNPAGLAGATDLDGTNAFRSASTASEAQRRSQSRFTGRKSRFGQRFGRRRRRRSSSFGSASGGDGDSSNIEVRGSARSGWGGQDDLAGPATVSALDDDDDEDLERWAPRPKQRFRFRNHNGGQIGDHGDAASPPPTWDSIQADLRDFNDQWKADRRAKNAKALIVRGPPRSKRKRRRGSADLADDEVDDGHYRRDVTSFTPEYRPSKTARFYEAPSPDDIATGHPTAAGTVPTSPDQGALVRYGSTVPRVAVGTTPILLGWKEAAGDRQEVVPVPRPIPNDPFSNLRRPKVFFSEASDRGWTSTWAPPSQYESRRDSPPGKKGTPVVRGWSGPPLLPPQSRFTIEELPDDYEDEVEAGTVGPDGTVHGGMARFGVVTEVGESDVEDMVI